MMKDENSNRASNGRLSYALRAGQIPDLYGVRPRAAINHDVGGIDGDMVGGTP